MIEIWKLLIIIPLCLGIGYIFAEIIGGYNRKKAEIKLVEARPEKDPEEDEPEKPGPMTLRNGMGVTRCEKPTFAEQLVNIMNYNGENQKEGEYEAGTDYSAEDLG